MRRFKNMNGKTFGKVYYFSKPIEDVFKALFRTGIMFGHDIVAQFGLSKKVLDRLIKEGYLIDNNNLITLGLQGRKYCEQQLGMYNPYRSKYTSKAHDLKLNKYYLRLDEFIRETWKTDTQIAFRIKQSEKGSIVFENLKMEERWRDSKENRFNFIPDAAIYSEELGGYIGIESVTSNYSKRDIEQKRAFAKIFLKGMVEI